MTLQHHAIVDLYNKDSNIFKNFFGGIKTITALCNRIDAISKDYHKYGYDDNEGEAKLKGDLFEIFVEIYFNLNKGNNRIGVYGYMPTVKDEIGVDGVGLGIDGKPLTVQIKYRSDARYELTDTDDHISSFTNKSYRKYKVDTNTVTNLVLVTSCKGLHWKTHKEVFDESIRCINIDRLSQDIDNNEPFWLGLNDLINETITERYKNPAITKSSVEKLQYVQDRINELHNYPLENIQNVVDGRYIEEYSQKRCFERMQTETKLSICFPTGVGKGHIMFVDVLNRIVNGSEKILTICSHRIMLNKQHMKDIFKIAQPFLGEIGYIFVASDEYELDEYRISDSDINNSLKNKGLDIKDLIKTVTNSEDLKYQIGIHKANNRKVIIISTYDSLGKLSGVPIDVIYCDEAHTLAGTTLFNDYRKNFEAISSDKYFFLTATPKDCFEEEEDVFLMSNKRIFGERIGMSFIVAVDMGYIINGYYHVVFPTNYVPDSKAEGNIGDRIEIIKKSYFEHKEHLKTRSAEPDKLGIKMLVKCKSVETDMWRIVNGDENIIGLKNSIPGVKIFAGGSLMMQGGYTCYMDGVYTTDRKKYLEAMKNMKSEDNAIILHYDILSEGINVQGITGVMFLSGVLASQTKILQNIGRATRLHLLDRENLKNGIISVDDKTKWIKPFCNIIIPFWDRESKETMEQIKNLLIRLRKIGFRQQPVAMGIDEAISNEEEIDEGPLNKKDKPKTKISIEDLNHEIEEAEYLIKDNNMPVLPHWYMINDIMQEVN